MRIDHHEGKEKSFIHTEKAVVDTLRRSGCRDKVSSLNAVDSNLTDPDLKTVPIILIISLIVIKQRSDS